MSVGIASVCQDVFLCQGYTFRESVWIVNTHWKGGKELINYRHRSHEQTRESEDKENVIKSVYFLFDVEHGECGEELFGYCCFCF